jgi:predicted nucleic acid-binding protein
MNAILKNTNVLLKKLEKRHVILCNRRERAKNLIGEAYTEFVLSLQEINETCKTDFTVEDAVEMCKNYL